MHSRRFLEGFGRATPDDDEPVAFIFGAELFDVSNERSGLIPFVGFGLDANAFDPADPALVEHGVHRNDTFELARDGVEVAVFHDAGGAGSFKGVRGEWVPAAKDEVAEVGEWDKLVDERVASLLALSEPDVGHLRDRSEWSFTGLSGLENAGDDG